MRLLIVNDAKLVADTMKQDIPWSACKIDDCLVAYSALEGKNIIKEQTVDILLCDIEMPQENGLSLIRWIRENHYDIECILLTCHADFKYAQEAVSLGCLEYILIPASYETISASILRISEKILSKQKDEKLIQYGRSWLHNQETSVSSSSSAVSKEDIINKCLAYIMNNLTREDLSITEIADHCYLNPIYLNRIFKKEKGTSIGQYIIQEKMALAANLLCNTNTNSNAIAIHVGYPNYSYFSTTFKKYYGMTPSQYRDKSES